MKKTIVTVMAIAAMLLTCNMAYAADVAIYVWSGANSENMLALFRAVEATGHKPYGIGKFDITNTQDPGGRLSDFDVLILPAGEEGAYFQSYLNLDNLCPLNLSVGDDFRDQPYWYNKNFTGAMKTAVQNFVSNGGGFVGIELGAYFATSDYPGGLGLLTGTYTPVSYTTGIETFNISGSPGTGFGGGQVNVFMSAHAGGTFSGGTPIVTTTSESVAVSTTYNNDPADPGGRVILTSLMLSLRADSEEDWTIWDNMAVIPSPDPHPESENAWKLLGQMIDWANGVNNPAKPNIASSNPAGGQKIAVASTHTQYGGAWPGLIPAVGKSIAKAGHIPLAIRDEDLRDPNALTFPGQIPNTDTDPDFTAVVFPGGNAYGYHWGLYEYGMHDVGVDNVRNFVDAGGGYLGICAGSYLGADIIVWGDVIGGDTGRGTVNGSHYPMDLFGGSGTTELTDTGPHDAIAVFDEDTDDDFCGDVFIWAPTDTTITDDVLGFNETQTHFYYGGGAKTNLSSDVIPVATYNALSGAVNAVRFKAGASGAGRVLLVGTHPEATSNDQDWLHWNNYEYDTSTQYTAVNEFDGQDFIDAALNRWLLPAGKGLAWLRENQVSPGSGSWNDYAAVNALCTLAFLNADFNENDDTMVSSAIANITSFFDSGTGAYGYPNYDNSICILPLVAANNPTAYGTRITDAKDSLLNFQNVGFPCGSGTTQEYILGDDLYGGWGYPGEPGGCDNSKWADLSNTQWSLMGLRFAKAYIPDEAWANMAENAFTWVKKVQDVNTDGGFTYTNRDLVGPLYWTLGSDSYSSMTYAGIWSYALLGKKGSPEMNAALGWVDLNYYVDSNFPADDFALYYYYLTMAKALAMAEPEQVVFNHNWKEDLIEKLAVLQNDDGSWVNSNYREMEDDPALCTAYAILALQAFQEIPSSFWLTIGIASPADLVVCDPQGRCCREGEGECNIPGATFSGDGHQTVTLTQLESGHYRLEFHATESGTVYLTINGWRGDEADPIITVEKDFDIEKSEELWEVFDSDLFLSSLVGPLTITVEEPEFAFCYPVANAGPDQTVYADADCMASVTLDGSGSSDCLGDELTYSWTWNGGSATGMSPTINLDGLGDHTITLIVNDGEWNSEPAFVTINVVDTIPPDISVSVSPDTLWPPNHKMVPVIATVSASDNCDTDPAIVLFSVVSSEPDDAKGGGDGKTTNDIQDADIGTEDYNISLRAERQGKGDGRIYTIRYQATDASGNSAAAFATVTVPHNQ